MKKIYKAPLTKVVKIQAEQMICESNTPTMYGRSATSAALEKEDDFDDFDESLW